ncbi:MAG: hypothetical protein Q4F33_06405 [Mycoplasmatota bacterium]|nr:hypothetical protein [Mycoplasmatota bacterium]
MKEIIIGILKDSKNYKKIAWAFIVFVLMIIMLYPIIDANFLYYKRISNRIEILDKITEIDIEKINNNEKLEQEYNLILNEIESKEDNYLNNIFINETSEKNKLIKFIAGAWMFILVGLIIPFTKDKQKGKRTFSNVLGGALCIGIGVLLGYGTMKIPTIINIIVNIILYQIILIYAAYSIATFDNKK